MKINPIRGTAGKRNSGKKRVDSAGSTAFHDVLSSASTGKVESELEKLFKEIDESSEQLKENPRLDHYKEYRERVARFIKMFLDQAYDVQQTSEMTLTGRQRHMVLVKKIDTRLEDLYHLFLDEIMDIEELVRGVEEVRGMLLDLYR